MKLVFAKLSTALATLALAISPVIAHAAVVVTPSRGTTQAVYDINCANDAHYYSIYNNSTLVQEDAGECDATDLAGISVGTYKVAVSASDLGGVDYEQATIVEETTFQITPDYSGSSGGTASAQITGNAATGYVADIGGWLVAQLPTVLGVLGALIGLGFLLTRVRRWIGKRA